jgi:hypothetical protein
MYQTIDDDLIATASHSTPSYRIDNGTVFNLLKPLAIGGEGWAHIFKFNNDRDGRKSWDAFDTNSTVFVLHYWTVSTGHSTDGPSGRTAPGEDRQLLKMTGSS